MEATPSAQGGDGSPSRSFGSSRKRSTSGNGGILSKFPFMRSAAEQPFATSPFDPVPSSDQNPHNSFASAMSQVVVQQQQQQKTRRRRGSLRKVALLGRGAQRERREARSTGGDIKPAATTHSITNGAGDGYGITSAPFPPALDDRSVSHNVNMDYVEYGLGISDITPRPSMDGFTKLPTMIAGTPISESGTTSAVETTNDEGDSISASPAISYSTTDDEDALHMGPRSATPSSSSSRPIGMSVSSVLGHDLPSIQRRRSATMQRPKSPLALTSLAGLSTTPLPPPDADWDYSETEWWGWVVLIVTWVVFVTGMGSCLGVWSWAWDVGTTPYAPPELEDDPTLPIVGYYPALILLTGVMAWVWVVVAWVGMKYFRHARVSGD